MASDCDAQHHGVQARAAFRPVACKAGLASIPARLLTLQLQSEIVVLVRKGYGSHCRYRNRFSIGAKIHPGIKQLG